MLALHTFREVEYCNFPPKNSYHFHLTKTTFKDLSNRESGSRNVLRRLQDTCLSSPF